MFGYVETDRVSVDDGGNATGRGGIFNRCKRVRNEKYGAENR